jgi:hypothetical protein
MSTPINQIRKQMNNPVGGGGGNMPTVGQPPMNQPMTQIPVNMNQPMPQIPAEMNQQSASPGLTDNQLVNDILKEMGDSPGADNQVDINIGSMNYAMDSSQVPPEKLAGNFLETQGQETLNPINTSMGGTSELINSMNSPTNVDDTNKLLNSLSLNDSSLPLQTRILNMFKYPVIVFVICIIISLPIFSRTLFSVFPKLLKESGEISILGVVLKAVIGAIIFGIVQFFV